MDNLPTCQGVTLQLELGRVDLAIMANMRVDEPIGRASGRLLLSAPSLGNAGATLATELENRGVEIHCAETVEEALQQAARTSFDLVICDLALPLGSGLDLLRALRARDVQIPAFLLCGAKQPLREAAELDAFCLQQPVEIGFLLKTALRRLLHHAPEQRWLQGSIRASTTMTDAVAATAAKNRFGELLGTAIRGGRVVITKHDLPSAVLMSYTEYQELTREDSPNLEALSREFDALLERMQTPAAHAATDALFRASPADLAKAARAQARKSARSPERG